jgi:hypothetical protein
LVLPVGETIVTVRLLGLILLQTPTPVQSCFKDRRCRASGILCDFRSDKVGRKPSKAEIGSGKSGGKCGKTRPKWNLAVMSGWSKLAKSAIFISFVIG